MAYSVLFKKVSEPIKQHTKDIFESLLLKAGFLHSWREIIEGKEIIL